METKTDIRKKVFRLRKEAPEEQILRDSHEIMPPGDCPSRSIDRAQWIYLCTGPAAMVVVTGEILRGSPGTSKAGGGTAR
ncbi:MAG: hypothetical protein ACLRT5_07185 [Lachnospiraceae bacterium]